MVYSATDKRKKLLVIGNGMAACRLLEEVLSLTPDLYQITVLSAERHAGYNRVLLSPVLSGESDVEAITTHPFAWYKARNIDLRVGAAVEKVDRFHRTVTTLSGDCFSYDRLVFATGATPRRLTVPGAEANNILTFRDLQDTRQLIDTTGRYRKAIVIGGGFLGIEAAEGLRARGMNVTLIHSAGSLLNRQLDEEAGHYLQRDLESRGLCFLMKGRTASFDVHENGDVRAVVLEDGRRIGADIVVLAIGIEPNVALARSCGIEVGQAIRVDDTLQTFDPAIYAIGECVEHRQRTFGLIAPLYEQAKVCAAHLAEAGHRMYRFTDTPTRLKVSGISVYSAGEFEDTFGGSVLVLRDPAGGAYRRLVLRSSKLVGIVLYGNTDDAAFYEQLLLAETDVSAVRDQLLFGQGCATPTSSVTSADAFGSAA